MDSCLRRNDGVVAYGGYFRSSNITHDVSWAGGIISGAVAGRYFVFRGMGWTCL